MDSKFSLNEQLVKRSKHGDNDAKLEIINTNINVIRKLVNSLYMNNDKLSREDLIQDGIIAMMKAIDNYDEKANIKFITYAYNSIRLSLISQIKKKYTPIRIYPQKISKLAKFKKDQSQIYSKLHSHFKTAEKMGISINQYEEMLRLCNLNELIYLDCPNETKEGEVSLYNSIADSSFDSYSKIEDKMYIHKLIEILPSIEKKVIEEIFFNNKTAKDISKELHLPYSKVLNIRNDALKKLRQIAKSDI